MPRTTQSSGKAAKIASGQPTDQSAINESAELNVEKSQNRNPHSKTVVKKPKEGVRINNVPAGVVKSGKAKSGAQRSGTSATARFEEDGHEVEFDIEAPPNTFMSEGEVSSSESEPDDEIQFELSQDSHSRA